jgi:hypothetical protein
MSAQPKTHFPAFGGVLFLQSKRLALQDVVHYARRSRGRLPVQKQTRPERPTE